MPSRDRERRSSAARPRRRSSSEPKLAVMSLRTTPLSVRTSAPLEPSPRVGAGRLLGDRCNVAVEPVAAVAVAVVAAVEPVVVDTPVVDVARRAPPAAPAMPQAAARWRPLRRRTDRGAAAEQRGQVELQAAVDDVVVVVIVVVAGRRGGHADRIPAEPGNRR